MSREDYETRISNDFIEENYGGSLPKFLAAFTRKNRLTEEEIAQLEELIENHKEE